MTPPPFQPRPANLQGRAGRGQWTGGHVQYPLFPPAVRGRCVPAPRPAARTHSTIARRASRASIGHPRRVRTEALPVALPFVSPICFDQACQQAADSTFVLVIATPLLVVACWVLYLLRAPPRELRESGALFEDERTGLLFQAPEGSGPERDKNGELAFRAVSYTPWPLEAGCEGERVRIDVGPVKDLRPCTFVFSKVLPQPSALVVVTLPRPLGLVVEYDLRRKRASVADCVEGSNADRKRRVEGLRSEQSAIAAALPGDVVRALTCTNVVYPTNALFGAKPPQRHRVLYGADGQSWAGVSGALSRGLPSDGEVTLVLERRLQPGQ